MEELELIRRLAAECGFTETGYLDVSTLQFRSEVRDMCAADKCGAYNKRWCCPPACGTVEAAAECAAHYKWGVIVQTVGHMEDEYDLETMFDLCDEHKEHFYALIPRLRELYPNMLPMSAGACTICDECAYPNSPCRHPDLAFPSMEAYGLVVSDVCTANGMKYYYGKLSIAYTSCFLLG